MAGPDGGVIRSSLGGISHGSCYPSVSAWEVLRASLKGAAAVVTPQMIIAVLLQTAV